MSGWLQNTQVLAEQAARYADLAERGELRELSRAVMRAACTNGSTTGVGVENMDLLRALPDGDRTELAALWAEWHARVEDDWTAGEFQRDLDYLRTELLMAASGVARGLDDDPMAAERGAQLALLGDQYVVWSSHRIWELADAELTAGRIPGPAVLAAFRRTTAAAALPGFRRTHAAANAAEPALRALMDRWPGPVLNSGEPWAEQALNEAAVRGEPWLRLLAHSAPATASAPSATWRRTAMTLIGEVGPDAVRAAVPRWFESAALARTVPLVGHPHLPFDVNTCFDAYNSHVLRGLAWTLALLPTGPDIVDALVGLVETSLERRSGDVPRAPHVAEAGIVALALTGDRTARTALETLRGWVPHQSTLLRIDKALGGTWTLAGR
ncbi:hypothetical protein ACFYRN_20895 [Streptomyces sp. NPDC005227]|uniref:hypothetical protein n=1 Tax=unclassified Streptomyces TaxID=2593676 RepID=UPI0036A68DEA